MGIIFKNEKNEIYNNYKFTEKQAQLLFKGLDKLKNNNGKYPYNYIALELHKYTDDSNINVCGNIVKKLMKESNRNK